MKQYLTEMKQYLISTHKTDMSKITKEDFISPKEAIKLLPVKLTTIRSWIFYKKIPIVKMGGSVFIKKEVIAYIQNKGLPQSGLFQTDSGHIITK